MNTTFTYTQFCVTKYSFLLSNAQNILRIQSLVIKTCAYFIKYLVLETSCYIWSLLARPRPHPVPRFTSEKNKATLEMRFFNFPVLCKQVVDFLWFKLFFSQLSMNKTLIMANKSIGIKIKMHQYLKIVLKRKAETSVGFFKVAFSTFMHDTSLFTFVNKNQWQTFFKDAN